MSGSVRDTHEYKNAIKAHRAECQDKQLGCWLCPPGQNAIDYTLKWPHPESFSTDHVLTVDEHPEAACDLLNMRPSHLICNQMRGSEPPHIDIGEPSEDW